MRGADFSFQQVPFRIFEHVPEGPPTVGACRPCCECCRTLEHLDALCSSFGLHLVAAPGAYGDMEALPRKAY